MRLSRVSVTVRRTIIAVAITGGLLGLSFKAVRLFEIAQERWWMASELGAAEKTLRTSLVGTSAAARKFRADAELLRQYRIPADYDPKIKRSMIEREREAILSQDMDRVISIENSFRDYAEISGAAARRTEELAASSALSVEHFAAMKRTFQRAAWCPWKSVGPLPRDPTLTRSR